MYFASTWLKLSVTLQCLYFIIDVLSLDTILVEIATWTNRLYFTHRTDARLTILKHVMSVSPHIKRLVLSSAELPELWPYVWQLDISCTGGGTNCLILKYNPYTATLL